MKRLTVAACCLLLSLPACDNSEAIRLNPKNADAYNYRGCAWVEKGELDKAITDFNEAIRLDPKDADAYHNRAIYYGQIIGNRAKAALDKQKAIELEKQ